MMKVFKLDPHNESSMNTLNDLIGKEGWNVISRKKYRVPQRFIGDSMYHFLFILKK